LPVESRASSPGRRTSGRARACPELAEGTPVAPLFPVCCGTLRTIRVSNVSDTRVPERKISNGILHGRRWSVSSTDERHSPD
jgi:hypothetical protein